MTSRAVRFAFRIPKARVALCVAALAGVMAHPALNAQSRPGGKGDIPLKINFGLDTSAHRITNDRSTVTPGQETIPVDYEDNVDNVLAVLYPSGNQGFKTQADTRLESVRTLCFGSGNGVPAGTNEPYDSRGTPPSFPAVSNCPPTANVNVVMVGTTGSTTAIQSMTTVNQSDPRLVRFDWTVPIDALSSYRYHLGHGTDMNANGTLDSAPAQVTCTAVVPSGSSNRCTTWTLTPQGPGALYRSLLTPGKGGKVTEGPSTYVGHYDMPFVETLTLK